MMSWNYLQAFALSIREDGTYAPFSGEAFKYAGEMTLLGMGMIFTVLALLWGVLAIFKLVFAEKAPKTEKPKAAPVAPAEPTSVEEAASAMATDDTALIAVLTAAVAAYRDAEGESGGFRVVSFKRASGSRGWNARK